jgi:hypothetical protein
MLNLGLTPEFIHATAFELVPRMKNHGYVGESVARRREWIVAR